MPLLISWRSFAPTRIGLGGSCEARVRSNTNDHGQLAIVREEFPRYDWFKWMSEARHPVEQTPEEQEGDVRQVRLHARLVEHSVHDGLNADSPHNGLSILVHCHLPLI